ncbi:hypothetical protein JNM87_04350 [Candidatus Saccharibacteria bacterium]|nr:hypothetical protein [Candidatus Saccharibacteria bacterium]
MIYLSAKRRAALTTLIALGTIVISPFGVQVASARNGSDDVTKTTTSTPSTSTSTTTTTTNTSSSGKVDDKLIVNKTEVERHVSDMRTSAQREIEKQKQEKGTNALTDDKRKLVCENRQNSINNKLSAFTQAADKHMAKLDETFTKVQSYQMAHSLTIANYDELVAAANEKKTAASQAIATLKTVAVNVDCTHPDSVVKLSTVRDAAKAARTALHDYRVAIKAVVVALAQAKGSDSSANSGPSTTSTTGGNQ